MNSAPILLVEDDPHSVVFFERSMREVGIENPLHIATDGQMALDYLKGIGAFADRTKYPFPGLVLLDLRLPHILGVEVLRQLRGDPKTQPLIVIVMTSSSSDDDIGQAYAVGANAYLVKPSRLEDLEGVARAIKDFWLTHNHPPPSSQ